MTFSGSAKGIATAKGVERVRSFHREGVTWNARRQRDLERRESIRTV